MVAVSIVTTSCPFTHRHSSLGKAIFQLDFDRDEDQSRAPVASMVPVKPKSCHQIQRSFTEVFRACNAFSRWNYEPNRIRWSEETQLKTERSQPVEIFVFGLALSLKHPLHWP